MSGLSNFDEKGIIEKLRARLLEKRLKHSINVMNMAVRLAKLNGVEEEKAKMAGLLHDCAKNMSDEELISYCIEHNIRIDDIKRQSPGTLHAEVGAEIAKNEFGADEDVYTAIKYHTLGNETMSTLDKILYVSDLIEEGRTLEGIDKIREIAFLDLNKAYYLSLDYCIENVRERGKIIHPQSLAALASAKEYN